MIGALANLFSTVFCKFNVYQLSILDDCNTIRLAFRIAKHGHTLMKYDILKHNALKFNNACVLER